MADRTLKFKARFSATELNKAGGKALDTALDGAVRITRRGQSFVLIREELLSQLLDAARDPRPQTLDDLLRDYDADNIKPLTRSFLYDDPAGQELIWHGATRRRFLDRRICARALRRGSPQLGSV